LSCIGHNEAGPILPIFPKAIEWRRWHPCSATASSAVVAQVLVWERWEGKLLPDFAPGMSFEPSVLAMRESSTCAPPLLSESDLIALMDTNGIGTDATIAEHIETIQTRKYDPPMHMHETHVCDLGLGWRGFDSLA
jgi:DNA topoisomerase IA